MSALLTFQEQTRSESQVLRNIMSDVDLVAQFMETLVCEGENHGWRI